MKCPYCLSNDTKVIDKRETSDLSASRRRRECNSCGKRFTTYERIELVPLVVIKKNGNREQFDRNKLRKGFLRACEKRPISVEQIDKVIDEIESELRSYDNTEIKSTLIGELVMDKLRDLDEVAYIRFASVYRQFADIAQFERELRNLKVVRQEKEADSTDLSLQVSTHSREVFVDWDRDKIIKALTREARIDKETAEEIAFEVERKVFTANIKTIPVGLIRELVDHELFIRGLGTKLLKQHTIGMPIFDLKQLIFRKSNENSNVMANNPEAVNLAIAENTLKKFALQEIFTKEVSNAHMKGVLHLHNLGYPIRVYCSSHSLEYLKKYGLALNNLSTSSRPAKHLGTLIGHLNTYLASMQAYYAGALGIGFVNVFMAPYITNMKYKEIKQQAQYLIFSCSQNAFSRGGQTLFIDFNIHLGIPNYLKEVPAVGPSGKYMYKKPNGEIEKIDEAPRDDEGNLIQPKRGRILTYSDFERESQVMAKALMDVWREGDSEGKPFPFPKFDLHVDDDTFNDPVQFELLKYACLIASENGSPYFFYDRGGEATLSQCCRLRTTITDTTMLKYPERIRFCGFQNVSINLPQAAYKGKTLEGTINEVIEAMNLAVKAHLQKKRFIEKIMKEPGTPLWQIGMPSMDGSPYLDLETATYIIGIVGLNEAVKRITGKALHESDEAYKAGLKIISAMYLFIKDVGEKTGLKLTLEETPAESASLRFAKIDLKAFPESRDYIRGNFKTGEIYYTNSVHLVPDAPISIIDRIIMQGKFNSLIESGAITHVFLGEQRPSPEAILALVKKTWDKTQSAQLVFSPEFTVCYDCHKVSSGFAVDDAKCSYCGSENVYGMSRVVGYYSVIKGKRNGELFEGWNKSKLGEFRDRQQGSYKLDVMALEKEVKSVR